MVSHRKLSNWYTQLAQHLEAGVPFADALRLARAPAAKSVSVLADRIERGDSVEEAISEGDGWLPKADRLFIIAALNTGNLPSTLKNLAERHNRVSAAQVKVVWKLFNPVMILHVIALLLPVIKMINYEVGLQWDTQRYITQALALLMPIWMSIVFVVVLARTENPFLPKILSMIPLLRKYVRMQAIADFSHSLGTFLAAGIPAPEAWRMSASISNDERIEKAVWKMEPTFQVGGDPGSQLDQFRCFPPDFKAYYKAGAKSGNLDESLITVSGHFQEKANTAMTISAGAYTALIMIGVAGLVIYTVFKVFGQYIEMLEQFM